MSVQFGTIYVASQLEEAVIELLQEWFPTYLRDLESELGLQQGLLRPPLVYTTRNSFEGIPGDRMPICVVISPGLNDEPFTREAGKYTARWNLGVGVGVAANDEPTANKLSKIYGACVRGIMMQHQSINGNAIRVDWLDENYDDLHEDQLQYYKSAGVYFAVEVENVLDKRKGPATPDTDPYPPLPTVQTTIVDVGRLNGDE